MTGPHWSDGTATLWHGDLLDVLPLLPDASIDAVVTDPPYGIGFMGHAWDQPGRYGPLRSNGAPGVHQREAAWDHRTSRARAGAMEAGRYDLSRPANARFQDWCEAWARECLRLLKPGGHLVSFGGSRTWHRLASGVEDAGFEIRDSIAWLYGQGFPKSLDVAQATGSLDWDGWGTALKPAFEPMVVGRKPLAGTVAATVLAHGTGALHIDAARTATSAADAAAIDAKHAGMTPEKLAARAPGTSLGLSVDPIPRVAARAHQLGRWPTNVVLDDGTAADLDLQTGVRRGGAHPAHREGIGYGGEQTGTTGDRVDLEPGGASRYFPTFRWEAKAPTSERPRDGETTHPTVKPLDLMRWLVRLVTPPGGMVLDPFGGSGTTGEACLVEGFRCTLVERHAPYLPLIVGRLAKPIQGVLL